MKIEASYQQQAAVQAGSSVNTRQTSDGERKTGDTIKGEVVDVRQEAVTIRTDDGKVMTARPSPPQEGIKAGQHVTVRLAVDKNGEMTFEFPKSDGKTAGVQQRALDAAGIAVTPENIKLIDTLLASSSPIDRATILKMIQAVRIAGTENPEKALFITANDMKPTARAIEKLDGYINGSTKISNQLQSIANEIIALPEGAMKEKLQEILYRANMTPLGGEAMPAEQGDIRGAAPAQTGTQTAPSQTAPSQMQTAEMQKAEMQTAEMQTAQTGAQTAELMTATEGQEAKTEQARQAMQPSGDHTPNVSNANEAIKHTEEQSQHIQRLINNAEVTLGSEDKQLRELKAMTENPDSDPAEIERLAHAVAERKSAEESAGSGRQRIMKHLALGLKDASTLDEAEAFLNNLAKKVSEIKTVLGGAAEDMQELAKALDSTEDNLEFMSHVKTGVYLQLPLMINDKQTNTELFVFKDKRGAKKQQGRSSALISLDLANLGHFETYVQKADRSVECQFRVAGDEVELLVRKNLPKLEELLKEHGYHLISTQFRQPDQAFNILNDEPDDKIGLDAVKRFSFDLKA